MPLYEYRCKNNHITERLAASHESADLSIQCGHCTLWGARIVSSPAFYLPWNPGQMSGQNMLEGTPLEDDDGCDHPYYKSTKVQVRMGASDG